MKLFYFFLLSSFVLYSCYQVNSPQKLNAKDDKAIISNPLANEVRDETLRSWQSYKKYAWGHDVLMPISKTAKDWYDEALYISPIDAYGTLHIMGFQEECKEIENYVVDSLDFNKDLFAKIFEVNIRILGGLLAMYEISGNKQVLAKAQDFAERMLPAFNTATGIPAYWVNLKTGNSKGDTVNVAEAASYTFEMGILSYYTKNPKYYQAGKKATLAIFERRSEIGLIGDVIDVQSGKWISEQSHICAGVDSYYEYLFKSYLLFGDEQLGEVWEQSIPKVHSYLSERFDGKLWYGRSNMYTGEKESSVITLYDAFFPAILSLSGDVEKAKDFQNTWDWLWHKYGLEPMVYDYKKGEANYPVYDLNPEIIESAYYLLNLTGDSTYYRMNSKYWNNIKEYCRNDVAFSSIENVTTMERRDYMPTFFFAETLKYFYLSFAENAAGYNLSDYLFTTEAHHFKRKNFNKEKAKKYLGIN